MELARTRSSSVGSLGRTIIVLAVTAFVAACTTPSGGGATNPPATSAAATPAPATGAAALTLEVATASVGDYVTGEGGRALYVFTPDEGDASACNGECATNWPPLVVDDISGVAAGTGVTGTLGTITRDDGSLQVTLGGSPLYYFSGDSAAGDTNGQGLNDVWHLAGVDGAGVGAPAAGGGNRY